MCLLLSFNCWLPIRRGNEEHWYWARDESRRESIRECWISTKAFDCRLRFPHLVLAFRWRYAPFASWFICAQTPHPIILKLINNFLVSIQSVSEPQAKPIITNCDFSFILFFSVCLQLLSIAPCHSRRWDCVIKYIFHILNGASTKNFNWYPFYNCHTGRCVGHLEWLSSVFIHLGLDFDQWSNIDHHAHLNCV